MLLRRDADTGRHRQTQADTRQVRGLKKDPQSGYKKIYSYAKTVLDRNMTFAKITANTTKKEAP